MTKRRPVNRVSPWDLWGACLWLNMEAHKKLVLLALCENADENGLWRPEAGPTVFATFESGTDYFGSRAQQTMLNFRVRDLDAMLAQLRAKGADVADATEEMDGVGRFGWVTDPEGNRIELWQPA